jgi:hypothetical protein
MKKHIILNTFFFFLYYFMQLRLHVWLRNIIYQLLVMIQPMPYQ